MDFNAPGKVMPTLNIFMIINVNNISKWVIQIRNLCVLFYCLQINGFKSFMAVKEKLLLFG